MDRKRACVGSVSLHGPKCNLSESLSLSILFVRFATQLGFVLVVREGLVINGGAQFVPVPMSLHQQ